MKSLLLCVFVVLYITDSSRAAIISSNGLKRCNPGDACVIQWTLSEPIDSYNIYSLTTGSQTALNGNSNFMYDKRTGVIILIITNVQLRDAGNYSLQVTTGTSTYGDSTACIFVYGSPLVSVALTFASQQPVTEATTLEFTCTVTSTSLPAIYRPNIFYVWHKLFYGATFQNISSGPAVLLNGYLAPGYSIKNNGRTFVISSTRYPFDNYVACNGTEEGSNLGMNSDDLAADRTCRPYMYRMNQPSRRTNIALGQSVVFTFQTVANPSITSITDWTFVNSAGSSQALPPNASVVSGHCCPSLSFTLTSAAYYGNYSITAINDVGSETVTLQVRPEGPPEAPSNVILRYVSHSAISVQWNIMWSNSLLHQQTIFLLLRLAENDTNVDSLNTIYLTEYYTTTYTSNFTNNLQPETDYTVSVWSVNSFGSSGVVEYPVRTRKQPKLIVSPETIFITGSQAIINFTVELGETMENISQVYSECCSEFSGQCSSYSGTYTSNQVVVNNIPGGNMYYIDLTVYSGRLNYYSDSVKAIPVSRSGNKGQLQDQLKASSDQTTNPLPIAVIILAILLGFTWLILIAILIAYLVKRFRQNRQPAEPSQLRSPTEESKVKAKQKKKEERPESEAEGPYQAMKMDSSNDDHPYTGVASSNDPTVKGNRYCEV